jgi:hypothetical protein
VAEARDDSLLAASPPPLTPVPSPTRGEGNAASPAARLALAALLALGVIDATPDVEAYAEEIDAAEVALPEDILSHADQHLGMLREFCVECHNFEDWAGGVAFDTMTADGIPHDAAIWEAAVRKLRGGLMPPPGEPRPDAERQRAFVAWMEGALDHAAAARPEPGQVVLHRLNRTEYANAIRDLLALEIDAAALLPQDDISDGFDNVADVLQVSPSFLEQYIAAADIVSGLAVGEPAPPPAGATFVVNNGSQHFHVEGLPLGTRGGGAVEYNFPADGSYVVSLNDMATGYYVTGMEYEQRLVVTLDGVKVYETTIGGEEDLRSIDQLQAPAVSAINERLKNIPFTAAAGPHTLAAAFVARTFAESDADLQSFSVGGGQDRVLAVRTFDIRGPFNPTGLTQTPSRQRIFTCYPQAASEEDVCAKEILSRIARSAFRRPITEQDLEGVLALYRIEKERAGFEAGVRGGLTAILASPRFLYRAETAPEGLAPGEVYEISDLELASRLAFFLWSSLPDEELLDAAASSRLREPEVLEAQTRRMLADPRAESLVTNFAFQWLRVRKIDGIEPDPKIFPFFDASLRDAFREEMRLFIGEVFKEDKSVLDLMTADYTYLNERLALHYGVNDVRGDRFRRVALADSSRWGILGKGAFLMGTSYPNRTAPVLRGAYILESITGTPPAAPPPGVEAFVETQEGEKALTVRERLIAHREDPVCNSCHGVMDPLGMALENFDAVGAWRERDRFAAEVIDASGELPDGTKLASVEDLRAALMRRPEQFVQTMTENLMTFALGRTVEHHDMPAVRAVVRDAADEDYRFSTLVLGVVKSAPFRMRTVPEAGVVEEAALR